jgi:hypothetical protein
MSLGAGRCGDDRQACLATRCKDSASKDMTRRAAHLGEDQSIMRRTSGGITLPAGSPAAGACAPDGMSPRGNVTAKERRPYS